MSALSQQPPVICLLGPTASGKTEAAIALAERGDIDVISVDSAMIYKDMDIGTAKPDRETLARVPHQLVDIREPTGNYSAGNFLDDALAAIAVSHENGRIPVLVGGTMMYFKVLFDGMATLPKADPAVRERLNARAAIEGWPALHRELAALDPLAASRIRATDSQRLQRALEVIELSGQKLSDLQAAGEHESTLRFVKIALINEDRKLLHERIAARFEVMLAAGFEHEVRALLAREGMHAGKPSMRAVGYRQMAEFINGEIEQAQAIADAKTATRRLAKRQFTWLRSMSQLIAVDPIEIDYLDRIKKIVAQEIKISS